MITRLRLKGFRRYVDETFELGPGVTFINGRNNAGKTTLFLAIEYALTGTVSGARSQAVLLNPNAKGLGVELVFTGRDGKTYKLQRLHQLPPRAKSKLVGAFTLKEVVGEGDERYLLSSDFQDHEDALAKKLAEITGISRRVLHLAVHVRQGEIAQILDGDARLDIALGITAATTANEEMRSLALEDEQAADALPGLEATLAHLERERAAATTDTSALETRLAGLRTESATLTEAIEHAEEVADDAAFEALADAVETWRDARGDVERAEDALEGAGDADAIERERDELEAAIADAEARRDETARLADLRSQIARRTKHLAATHGATCEYCGSTMDRARGAAELAAWTTEAAALEADAVDEPALRAKLRDAMREQAALTAATAALARARTAATAAETAARAHEPGDPRSLEEILEERRGAAERGKLERATTNARNEARLEAVTASIDEIETRAETQARRGGELDREHARTSAEVDRLRARKRRADDLRVLASAFKELQEQLRTRAAAELAVSTFAIYEAIAVDREVVGVEVDPARYQVMVTSKDTDVAMPASLAQGGGHRLLLGLAFRLALVQRLGPFPFMLLDEPTYGLDEYHRHALLQRIAGLNLCEQILLITHQEMGTPDRRISIGTVAA